MSLDIDICLNWIGYSYLFQNKKWQTKTIEKILKHKYVYVGVYTSHQTWYMRKHNSTWYDMIIVITLSWWCWWLLSYYYYNDLIRIDTSLHMPRHHDWVSCPHIYLLNTPNEWWYHAVDANAFHGFYVNLLYLIFSISIWIIMNNKWRSWMGKSA